MINSMKFVIKHGLKRGGLLRVEGFGLCRVTAIPNEFTIQYKQTTWSFVALMHTWWSIKDAYPFLFIKVKI